MTTEELEKIIEDRLKKVIEDANKEFARQFIISAANCCGDGEFEVTAEKFHKPIEEYTKEELVKIIKDTILLTQEKISGFEHVIWLLNQPGYVRRNEEELKKIDFGISLAKAKRSLQETKKHFIPIIEALLQADDAIEDPDHWRAKYNVLKVSLSSTFDVIKFFKG